MNQIDEIKKRLEEGKRIHWFCADSSIVAGPRRDIATLLKEIELRDDFIRKLKKKLSDIRSGKMTKVERITAGLTEDEKQIILRGRAVPWDYVFRGDAVMDLLNAGLIDNHWLLSHLGCVIKSKLEKEE